MAWRLELNHNCEKSIVCSVVENFAVENRHPGAESTHKSSPLSMGWLVDWSIDRSQFLVVIHFDSLSFGESPRFLVLASRWVTNTDRDLDRAPSPTEYSFNVKFNEKETSHAGDSRWWNKSICDFKLNLFITRQIGWRKHKLISLSMRISTTWNLFDWLCLDRYDQSPASNSLRIVDFRIRALSRRQPCVASALQLGRWRRCWMNEPEIKKKKKKKTKIISISTESEIEFSFETRSRWQIYWFRWLAHCLIVIVSIEMAI